MNVESLKSELQQVLDNDVILRKEFTALKRSLSDYRNQLIMRDEDCKRLQVTIDVLNTKLVVVERDCNSYKAELSTFRELRGTIQEELEAKQLEIESRLSEIQTLRDDLNTMAAGYEKKIEDLRSEAGNELAQVKQVYIAQIEELRTNIHYKENGIKEEYENRVSELSMSWSDKEQNLLMVHDEAISKLKETHAEEVNALNEQFISQLTAISSTSHEEVAALKLNHQQVVLQMEEEYNSRLQALEENSTNEIARLKAALEEQRNTLTVNFNDQIENLTSEFVTREAGLIQDYEARMNELTSGAEARSKEMSEGYNSQIAHLKGSFELNLAENNASYESRIAALVNEYEEKLSNTLIHSNSQNTRLNDELTKVQASNEQSSDIIDTLNREVESRNGEISALSARLGEVEFLLRNETERLIQVSGEFDEFRQNALLTNDEKITELNNQISALNHTHSDYVGELTGKIEHLNDELGNMTAVLERTTNNLAETEITLELRMQELETSTREIEYLSQLAADQEESVEKLKAGIEAGYKKQIEEKEIEFQKLLVENSNIINEIDLAQDKIEAQEAEIQILKAELDEVRSQSIGKAEYFKETLSTKNFEITNLEANNAAYAQEITHLKSEVDDLTAKLSEVKEAGTQLASLQELYDAELGQKIELVSGIGILNETITTLNRELAEVSAKAGNLEKEMEILKAGAKSEEQDAFIDRLFKQIDTLNDQRMVLLDEKEQMALQLLKMNEVIGSISQQVDSEQIDVTSLNNHRKNIILATNSEGNQGSPMKEQINDLVREIDKCIALLSA